MCIYIPGIYIYIYIFPSHPLPPPFFAPYSLIRSRNSDPGSHSSPPTPLYGTYLAFFSREGFNTFFSRRLASDCAYPTLVVGVLGCWCLPGSENSTRRIEPLTSTLTNSSVQGYPLPADHRGNRLYRLPGYINLLYTSASVLFSPVC